MPLPLPVIQKQIRPSKSKIVSVPIEKKSFPVSTSLRPTVLPENKVIAFTFDDGPHPKYTERLLKILGDYHVPATFFVVGKQVERYPELLQKIFQEGHEIGNHSYSHRNLKTLTTSQFEEDLEKTDKLVESITEQKMKFFRPPGGQYNEDVVEEGKNLGYTMALWNVFPQDHLSPSPEAIRQRVLKSAQNNGIVLMHSGIENTLLALPEIIVELKKRGYHFVTLSQMHSDSSGILPLARIHSMAHSTVH